MGVELGKVLAKNILSQLEKPDDVIGHDSSVCLSSNSRVWRPECSWVTCHLRLPVSSTTIRNLGRSERNKSTV